MPHAKLRANPLKTVAVHKEVRNTQIQFYICKIHQYKCTTCGAGGHRSATQLIRCADWLEFDGYFPA